MAAMTREIHDFVPWPSSTSKLSAIGSSAAVYRGTAFAAVVSAGAEVCP